MDGGTRAIRELLEAPGLSPAGVAAPAPAPVRAPQNQGAKFYTVLLMLYRYRYLSNNTNPCFNSASRSGPVKFMLKNVSAGGSCVTPSKTSLSPLGVGQRDCYSKQTNK